MYDRKQLLEDARGSLPGGRITKQDIDARVGSARAWLLNRLGTRRCPMTAEGLARVCRADIYGQRNKPHIVALNELVAEGVIIETHNPDGIDTYHLPGGINQPPVITDEEVDLIVDLTERNDVAPGLRSLAERLASENLWRRGLVENATT